jgi:single-stranded-DNA-specific exonuclease
VRTFDAMTQCAAHFERFGGHQAASGLTIRSERIAAFRDDFAVHTRRDEGSHHAQEHRVDVVVGSEVFALPTARELLLLEPVGEANREPVFMLERVRVEHSSIVGRGHLKLGVRVGEQLVSAFGLDLGERLPARGTVLDLVGALRIDGYRGDGSLELRLADFAPSA